MKVIYLAQPYTHKCPLVRETRYHKALAAEAKIIRRGGICVINPIGMCHELSKSHTLPTGYEYWKERDRTLIERSDETWVLMMDGWRESVGVKDEIAYTRKLGKPIIYLDEKEYIDHE